MHKRGDLVECIDNTDMGYGSQTYALTVGQKYEVVAEDYAGYISILINRKPFIARSDRFKLCENTHVEVVSDFIPTSIPHKYHCDLSVVLSLGCQ